MNSIAAVKPGVKTVTVKKTVITKSMREAQEAAAKLDAVIIPLGNSGGHTLVTKAEAERRKLIDAAAAKLAAQEAAPEVKLTEKSAALFLAYWDDAGNWSGTPLVGGNVGGSKQDRGNLTQLKQAGLIETFETHDGKTLTWIKFTPAGEAFAAKLRPVAEAAETAAPVVEAPAAPVKVKAAYNPQPLKGAAEAGKQPTKGTLPAGLLAYLAKKHAKSAVIAAAVGAPAKPAEKARAGRKGSKK